MLFVFFFKFYNYSITWRLYIKLNRYYQALRAGIILANYIVVIFNHEVVAYRIFMFVVTLLGLL